MKDFYGGPGDFDMAPSLTSGNYRESGSGFKDLFFPDASNLDLQRDWFQYQKDLQTQIFDREDTAVQRRMKDMEDAGLNPLLAAGGQGAGAGAVVPTAAPQRGSQHRARRQAMVNQVAQMMQMKKNFERTDAEMSLLSAQRQKEMANADYLGALTSRTKTLETADQYSLGFAKQYDPLRKEELELRNQFDREFNPKRLEQINIELRGKRLDNVNKVLNSEIKLFEITQQEVKAITNKLQQELLAAKIPAQMQDTVVKQALVNMLNAQTSMYRHNADWYKDKDLPYNIGYDAYVDWAMYQGERAPNAEVGAKTFVQGLREFFGIGKNKEKK